MIDHLLKAFLFIVLIGCFIIVLDLIPMDEDVLNAELMQESMSKDCFKTDGVVTSAKSLFFCAPTDEKHEAN
ncbi:hypothetical protein [Propionivibrio sp.]|uniref:hypothetical protein n=1 Tax=Propionivibrio sp. TaxID=2212460 RepID=UPI003BF33464